MENETKYISVEEFFGDNYTNTNSDLFEVLEDYMHLGAWVGMHKLAISINLETNEVDKAHKMFKSRHIKRIKEVGAIRKASNGKYYFNPYLAHGSRFVFSSDIISLFKGSLISVLYEAQTNMNTTIN
jgi:hypothetical protein